MRGQRYDHIVDCIDSVAPKVQLIAAAVRLQVPILSAMGAGGKVDAAQVQVCGQRCRTCYIAIAVPYVRRFPPQSVCHHRDPW